LPDLGESISSRNGDPLQFHDVQDGKSGCYNSGIRREVGKSTFGTMDDSLRTGLYTFNYFWLEYLLHGSSRVRKLGRTIDK